MHDCMPLNNNPPGGAVYADRLLSLVTTPLGKPQPPSTSPKPALAPTPALAQTLNLTPD